MVRELGEIIMKEQWKKIKLIRSLYKTGNYYQKELGGMFGVCGRHIGNIVNRKLWRHI